MEPDLHKRHYFVIDHTKTNTPLYADDQDIIADSDDNLQKGVLILQNIKKKLWNGNITEKSETMAFLGQDSVRCNIVVNNKCLQVKHFRTSRF
jgi:hypothetical protein